MKPQEGTVVYGVHKDLTGDQIDDPKVVADCYELVQTLGDVFKGQHPELEIVSETVVDIVFVHPVSDEKVQRVEWQALAKESPDAKG